MKIIQVVRRYGPVGGMERYVWELTHELRNLGHEVIVICEVCRAEKPQGIAVYETGEMVYRPRWLYYWRFGRRVAKWLRAHPQGDCLIHSHERANMHQVTTFHGPPFATVHDKPWWKMLSLRVVMQLYMERRELRVAQRIVPNSEIIARQLAHYYPEYTRKLTAPIVPGVAANVMPRLPKTIPQQGGIIGFVGKEWQRKGLPLAVEIVAQLRRERPELEFWVVGADEAEIKHLFADWDGGYKLLGWRKDAAHFQSIDVLLHPAKAEPYGMVISEAMATGIPVVISDQCGAAAQVSTDIGAVLPLAAPITSWIAALQQQLNRSESVQPFVRSWQDMAREYQVVYAEIVDLSV
ncbi:MAG: glycosyltransferase family 4 protein [Gallionella sp.]|nr:glycosyltransferase family 4 protein [Gallionella sp.]MDD4957811.1 glycosyltransferase family 4 protein [Gallionella sp.]